MDKTERKDVLEVLSSYPTPGKIVKISPWGQGHIQRTFRINFSGDISYILQKLNHHVFPAVSALVENTEKIIRHIHGKLKSEKVEDVDRKVLTQILTRENQPFLCDPTGNYWRAFLFITDSCVFDNPKARHQPYEAGRLFGQFQNHLQDFKESLHLVIPDFHDTEKRFVQLEEAAFADRLGHVKRVAEELSFARDYSFLANLLNGEDGEYIVPQRIVHNDTKLNNVLFDRNTGRGLCVIDLDTVMPGSVIHDFGDMIRSMTRNGAEDEKEQEKIFFRSDFFESLVKGYLETALPFLTEQELKLLPLAGQIISYELGLRFLADYLNGDNYFKTNYSDQNLNRAKSQFHFVRILQEKEHEMGEIFESCM